MNFKDKAKLILKEMDKAYRSDMEYGQHKLNEEARKYFEEMYPEITQSWFFASDFLEEIIEGQYDSRS
jgi:hypothetical protein